MGCVCVSTCVRLQTAELGEVLRAAGAQSAPVSRVRQTEYLDTVPFASLASEFHLALEEVVTWPVCAGYRLWVTIKKVWLL